MVTHRDLCRIVDFGNYDLARPGFRSSALVVGAEQWSADLVYADFSSFGCGCRNLAVGGQRENANENWAR
jgi:hypothetical protein